MAEEKELTDEQIEKEVYRRFANVPGVRRAVATKEYCHLEVDESKRLALERQIPSRIQIGDQTVRINVRMYDEWSVKQEQIRKAQQVYWMLRQREIEEARRKHFAQQNQYIKKTGRKNTDIRDLRDALDIMEFQEVPSAAELKIRFRTLIKKYHPDKHQQKRKEILDYAQRVTAALSVANKIIERNIK